MLYDTTGNRKYLTSAERQAFLKAARAVEPKEETFALALAYTGARISEILALTPRSIDFSLGGLVIRTLKRRRTDIFRVVPVPTGFLERLNLVHEIKDKQTDAAQRDQRIWKWSRTTAWSRIKGLMRMAGVTGACATPKGLRHGLGVVGTAEANVPLNVMQRWLGHARIETTALYAQAIGKEERALASRTWPS